jgi:uncharacterized protein YhaN
MRKTKVEELKEITAKLNEYTQEIKILQANLENKRAEARRLQKVKEDLEGFIESQREEHRRGVCERLGKLEEIIRGPGNPTVSLVPVGLVDDPAENVLAVETDGWKRKSDGPWVELKGSGSCLEEAIDNMKEVEYPLPKPSLFHKGE